jgi:hypothetical protein
LAGRQPPSLIGDGIVAGWIAAGAAGNRYTAWWIGRAVVRPPGSISRGAGSGDAGKPVFWPGLVSGAAFVSGLGSELGADGSFVDAGLDGSSFGPSAGMGISRDSGWTAAPGWNVLSPNPACPPGSAGTVIVDGPGRTGAVMAGEAEGAAAGYSGPITVGAGPDPHDEQPPETTGPITEPKPPEQPSEHPE